MTTEQINSMWNDAVAAYDRGDVVVGELSERRAADQDPRIPPGRGPEVDAAVATQIREARERIRRSDLARPHGLGAVSGCPALCSTHAGY